MELESNSAKKQPANNSPAEMYRILVSSVEWLKERMDMKALREYHKENKEKRQLKLKTEHAKQQQVTELQKRELQTRPSEPLFAIIQERQNQGNH